MGRADCELRAKKAHGGVKPAEYSVDPLNANNQAGCHRVTGEGFKMNKYKIITRIEQFAPLETQEKWDCSGWLVESQNQDIKKIMLCLTVTDDIVRQAREHNCDMIISHHPLFTVPLNYHLAPAGRGRSCSRARESVTNAGEVYKSLDIYCAHTNFDRAQGGTTDTLIRKLFPRPDGERIEFLSECSELRNSGEGFTRYINYETSLQDFVERLKTISPHLRYVNNKGVTQLKRIAFCAGSGTEFIQEAFENGADALVTGDLKFHTALDSPIVVFDIGHFESEILVLPVFEQIIGDKVEFVYAKETTPFISI